MIVVMLLVHLEYDQVPHQRLSSATTSAKHVSGARRSWRFLAVESWGACHPATAGSPANRPLRSSAQQARQQQPAVVDVARSVAQSEPWESRRYSEVEKVF